MSHMQSLKQLYNVFDPAHPLEAGDPSYMDCQEVRGDFNPVEALSREILWADNNFTCQLYTGHRGGGKSTELKRLIHDLKEQGYQVVYFDALEDIDPEDACYADILVACTRRLLAELKTGEARPVQTWFETFMASLKEFGLTSLEVENFDVSFANFTAKIKAVPTSRRKIRQALEPHTPNLIQVLNEFIRSVQKNHSGQLVLIIDSLDRIVPVVDPSSGRINHDEIFLDRSEQLKGLACHVIYTVPISMVYSTVSNHLTDRYGRVKVLPMVKLKDKGTRTPYPYGIDVFKQLILKRIHKALPDRSLLELFANEEVVTTLCMMSGGNVRELMHLIRDTLKFSQGLPITMQAVQRAISELREVYRRMIHEEHWKRLIDVYITQDMPNLDEYRKLLYDRCILEYRQIDPATQNIESWHDVHPLIVGTEKFRSLLISSSSPH